MIGRDHELLAICRRFWWRLPTIVRMLLGAVICYVIIAVVGNDGYMDVAVSTVSVMIVVMLYGYSEQVHAKKIRGKSPPDAPA
jgi:hypothetical protein